MAECFESLREACLEEQQEEITVLQSIFEDDLQVIQDGNEKAHIRLNLTVKVNIPHDVINLEAFVPADDFGDLARGFETRGSYSDDGRGRDLKEDKESGSPSDNFVVANSPDVKRNGEEASPREEKAEYQNCNSPESSPDGFTRGTKPGFTRSPSFQHWYVKADVRHLTPIHLTCTFPPLYPTEYPPEVSLACLWLTRSQLQELHERLMKLWTETPNLPVVFTWADWLQNYTYEYLHLDSHLVLKESLPCKVMPQAAKGDALNNTQSDFFLVKLETALLTIFEYDLGMKKQALRQGKHSCEICFDEREGADFHYLDECGHFFCTDCLKAHCELHVDGGTVLNLLCPSHDCKIPIPPETLREVLDAEKLARWERLLFSRTLDAMGGVMYCPRCNLAVTVDKDETLRLGHCANCFFAFCTECHKAWHHGLPCPEESESDLGGEDNRQEALSKRSQRNQRTRESEIQRSQEEPDMRAAKWRVRNCQRCFVEKDKSEFHYLFECGHFFCSPCLEEHYDFARYKDRIRCPKHNCKGTVSLEILEKVLDEESFKYCEKLFLGLMCRCERCSVETDKFHCLSECRHFFCCPCLKAHCQWFIDCGNVTIHCPSGYCEAIIPESVVKQVLDKEKLKQLKKLLLVRKMDEMGIAVDCCPRCAMALVTDTDHDGQHGHCENCLFEFCKECYEPWHPGKQCVGEPDLHPSEGENVEASKSEESNEQEDSIAVAISPGKPSMQKTQSMSNLSYIRLMRQNGSYQCCPKCRMAVERIAGCNMMHCAQCGAKFCWICGKEISGYEHFSKCGKEDLRERELDPLQAPKQERVEEQEPVADKQPKPSPRKNVRSKQCPRCRQRCQKDDSNNNHLKCWNCKTNFCYQCRKIIKVAVHFTAASLCVQFSDD